ncbi:hypothetical protein HC931_18805 [Candidatus Gracilibacteria bacterium]|nr:hypothetical protein [Candidatus Gracilibacteria bacterium]NJM88785.1 hypothetical protein [Hydrococcus sp. RU_2_2]NJP21844.1 hypothetical protein [Hydrococcus sp. CRU_1_1]
MSHAVFLFKKKLANLSIDNFNKGCKFTFDWLLEDHLDELARTITQECGKVVVDAILCHP